MKVKSFFEDVINSAKAPTHRKNVVKKATHNTSYDDPIMKTSDLLHPGKIFGKVFYIEKINEHSSIVTFSSMDNHFPYFKAMTSLTIEIIKDAMKYTYPLQIISSPSLTKGNNPLVSVYLNDDNEILSYLLNTIKIDEIYTLEFGIGQFFYEPLRDSSSILGISQNEGIVPFFSLNDEINSGRLDLDLSVLSIANPFDDEFIHKKNMNVLSLNENYKEYLKEYILFTRSDISCFISGSFEFCNDIKDLLLSLNIKERRIRINYINHSILNSYTKEYRLTLKIGISKVTILCKENESIASCLERNGYDIHIGCRKGECGFCRVQVLEGEYYFTPKIDYRREMDKEYNYVHSCQTYPLTDMTIRINIK